MTSQLFNMTSTSNCFWRCFVSLVNFNYWSKFHVNIITGSGIIINFFYKGLTRNPDIRNTPVWVLANILRLGQVMDTKFGTNVFNTMLLIAEKFKGYSFYSFWGINGKPTGKEGGGGGKITLGGIWTILRLEFFSFKWGLLLLEGGGKVNTWYDDTLWEKSDALIGCRYALFIIFSLYFKYFTHFFVIMNK